MKIYHIDSSARKSESVSKSLAKLLVERIKNLETPLLIEMYLQVFRLYLALKDQDLLFQKMKEPRLIKNYLKYPMN